MRKKQQGSRYRGQGTRRIKRSFLVVALLFSIGTVRAQLDTLKIEEPPPAENFEPVTGESEEKYFSDLQSSDTSIVQPRRIPAKVVTQMQEDDDFWYANADIKKDNPEKDDDSYKPLGDRLWFRTLVWAIIIAGFAGFIIWYLTGDNIGLFRKKTRKVPEGETGEETMPEDIFAINYPKEIDKAARAGNYRLAIRLYFLQLLKDMSEKNIISYKQDRTNFDYVLQLHNTSYYDGFFRLTRNYEYSWYGQFDISQDTYAVIKNDFDQFNHQIK